MRDKRFIAEHRGGLLTKEQHRQLTTWACRCVRRVMRLAGEKPDDRLRHALLIARAWTHGKAATGDARNASLQAIAAARACSNPAAIAVARAAGHAVATAHMADHSLRAALYALKAAKHAGRPVALERAWQNRQLPPEVRDLVLSSRVEKEKYFHI